MGGKSERPQRKMLFNSNLARDQNSKPIKQMLLNQAALIELIKEKPQLWEVEFDGDIKKIKTIAPINPKHIVEEN